jgi:hypothetical protein
MSHLIPIKEDVHTSSVPKKVETPWVWTQMVLPSESYSKIPKQADHIFPQVNGWPYAPHLVMAHVF